MKIAIIGLEMASRTRTRDSTCRGPARRGSPSSAASGPDTSAVSRQKMAPEATLSQNSPDTTSRRASVRNRRYCTVPSAESAPMKSRAAVASATRPNSSGETKKRARTATRVTCTTPELATSSVTQPAPALAACLRSSDDMACRGSGHVAVDRPRPPCKALAKPALRGHPGLRASGNRPRGIYTSRRLYYIEHRSRRSPYAQEEKPMRAEAEKLVEAIRDSLELLRRHL